ncbi:MAG TPA: AMP-binding protein [Candidatus Acidoferrales bacterium]|nr:AMP-binding protein [Candidatus Acidoferrales bacterium]
MTVELDKFLKAREFLQTRREDYESAYYGFKWPDIENFNWAIDYFDSYAEGNNGTALWIVDEKGSEWKYSFAEMSERSSRVANFLKRLGVSRGNRVLLMLDNQPEIWEVMLAAIKLGAVLIPSSFLLTKNDIQDRIRRGRVKLVIATPENVGKFDGIEGEFVKVVVGPKTDNWIPCENAYSSLVTYKPDVQTKVTDTLFLYFTSGTTAQPKMVLHTNGSYPIGHLSTMYWLGAREGDLHMNISSPGWAKHAWSSFFAPWNAGAGVFVYKYARFIPKAFLEILRKHKVNALCAPPTVWRMLILEDLKQKPESLRELVSAGEPLNPEVIMKVKTDWGITIRDGYGQTESTLQIGNMPGSIVKVGAMGRPAPGYRIELLDADGAESDEGEIVMSLDPRPLGLMINYADDIARTKTVMSGGYYRTGDVATRDQEGYFWFVGRGDDLFKSSDYRISPFEIESVLIESPAVAEAAVIPAPDPIRGFIPKAYVTLAPGFEPSLETAKEVLDFVKSRVAPFKRLRRIEFVTDLPKTISGKIRRVQLRSQEANKEMKGEFEFLADEMK